MILEDIHHNDRGRQGRRGDLLSEYQVYSCAYPKALDVIRGLDAGE